MPSKIVEAARQLIDRAFGPKLPKQPRITMPPPNRVSPTLFDSHLGKLETDAFRMKALVLLNPHGFYDSIQEKMASLEATPLERHPDIESNQITLSQVLQPFPGERIQLRGTFERKTGRTVPITNSFVLEKVSHVTGFPHPAQHIGWALSEAFLDDPKCLEKIRSQLLPGEPLRQLAKQWVAAKRRAFERSQVALCEALRTLITAVFGSESPVIDDFFTKVATRNDCYDFISTAHAQVLDLLVKGIAPTDPYQALLFEALARRMQDPRLRKCARNQFSKFLNQLQTPPPSLDALESDFRTSITSEVAFLTAP